MSEIEIGFFDYLSRIRTEFESQVTDKNQIWTAPIFLKREKKIELTNGSGKGKQTVIKSEWITDQMITMALLTPAGEILPGNTNESVINRNIRNQVGDKFTIANIYKFEKIKFLGNSQIKIDL